jgi:hypothetical protein
MSQKFTIIGAGMAGLFAAAVLREECNCIVESQKELPNNHAALLRFKSSVVGDTLNIPFKPISVIKTVHTLGNPVADAVSYSLKTNGSVQLRSLVTAEGKPERRYIAPEDFIPRLRNKVSAPVFLGEPWDAKPFSGPVISTVPMPVLMKLLGYSCDEAFSFVNGYAVTAHLRDCDIGATVYIPDRNELAYRASITGSKLIVEYAFPGKSKAQADQAMDHLINGRGAMNKHLTWVMSLMGLRYSDLIDEPQARPQPYAKILPISEDARKRFLLWATEHHNVYSFGRFATWRPGLLLDDLVNDLRVIQRLANGGTSYDARKS